MRRGLRPPFWPCNSKLSQKTNAFLELVTVGSWLKEFGWNRSPFCNQRHAAKTSNVDFACTVRDVKFAVREREIPALAARLGIRERLFN
jgi:hypothetical protein